MSQFIEAILFAEFDIDKGSVLRQQYPEKSAIPAGELAWYAKRCQANKEDIQRWIKNDYDALLAEAVAGAPRVKRRRKDAVASSATPEVHAAAAQRSAAEATAFLRTKPDAATVVKIVDVPANPTVQDEEPGVVV